MTKNNTKYFQYCMQENSSEVIKWMPVRDHARDMMSCVQANGCTGTGSSDFWEPRIFRLIVVSKVRDKACACLDFFN